MKEGNRNPSATCSVRYTAAVRGSGPARGDHEERSSCAMAQEPRQK